MPLDTLSDAEFVGIMTSHLRTIENDHNGTSIRLAQEFENRKRWLDENRDRIKLVLSVDALADLDRRVGAVDGSITKLFADGLQSQSRETIKAGALNR